MPDAGVRLVGWCRLAALVFVVGIVLSPLHAAAATIPVLPPYDAAAGPAATASLERPDTGQREGERSAITDYDCPHIVCGDAANLPVVVGAADLRSCDGALQHADRGEVYGEGTIYDAPSATEAAEGVGATENALTRAAGTVARTGEDIPATFIGQESGPSIVVPSGATGPTPALNGAGVRYTGGAGGPGLDARVSGLRIMDPTARYPGGYASYSNAAGQTVNPLTGQTIAPANPWWHIVLPW